MTPTDPTRHLPPVIAAHLGILRRDVDEAKADQKSHDRKPDLTLDRVAELSGKVGHLPGRLEKRWAPVPTDGPHPGSPSPSRRPVLGGGRPHPDHRCQGDHRGEPMIGTSL
jgi:hypothetical protein